MLLWGAGKVVADEAVGSVVGLCGWAVWVHAVGGELGGGGEAGEGVLLESWRGGGLGRGGMPGGGIRWPSDDFTMWSVGVVLCWWLPMK